MKLVVGLGNPGSRYVATRHNAGMAVFSAAAFRTAFGPEENFRQEKKFDSELLKFSGTMFAKPLTYMNRSGQAVRKLCEYYGLKPYRDLLVLHDEVDLPLGTWKRASNSSSAGHNGVQSIIDALGTKEFHRVRIGIETRTDKNIPTTEDYVLQPFTPQEQTALAPVLEQVVAEIYAFIQT